MKFRAYIPNSNKAFQIPGTRTEARILLDLAETEVPKALKLILRRGEIFDMSFQILEEVKSKQELGLLSEKAWRKSGEPIHTLASISSRDGAIRISGTDGMSIIFAIPALDDELLVQLLGLREHYLELWIAEPTKSLTTRAKAKTLPQPAT